MEEVLQFMAQIDFSEKFAVGVWGYFHFLMFCLSILFYRCRKNN